MRALFFLGIIASALLACASEESGGEAPYQVVCPRDWSPDSTTEGGCRASDEALAALRANVPTGIAGYVRLTTGVCGLCEVNCSCNVRLPPDVEIRAWVASEVDARASNGCAAGEVLPAIPLARTTTDASGFYTMKLAAGDYFLVATDPGASDYETRACNFSRRVTVTNDVVLAPFVFDHGAW